MIRKKALGRGIAAMIPTGGNEEKGQSGIDEISVHSITANPYQPRKDFKEDEMMELVSSITEHGIIQPITVRELSEGNFELISGERRLRACKYLNYETIPAYIKHVDDDQNMMEMALIENIQRENLNPIEEAEAYNELQEKYSLSQEEVAHKVGKKRSTVANSLRLLRLPTELQQSLCKNNVNFSAGHARALLALSKDSQKIHLWQKILEQKLSVRKTEELVKHLLEKKSSTAPKAQGKTAKSPYIKKVEDQLQNTFGTKVRLKSKAKGKGGNVEIEYYSQEDLERLLEIFESITL